MAVPINTTRGGAHNPIDINEFILDYVRNHGEAHTGEIQHAYHDALRDLAGGRGRRRKYHLVTYNSFRCYVWRLKKDGELVLSRTEPTEGTHGQFKGFDPLPVIHYYSIGDGRTGQEVAFLPETTSIKKAPRTVPMKTVSTVTVVEEDEEQPTPEKDAFIEKWEDRDKNIRNIENDMHKLLSDKYVIDDLETAIEEYRDLSRADFSDNEEYQEERDGAWENIIEVARELELAEE